MNSLMIAFSFQLMCASVNATAVKADRCPLKPATGPCKAVFTGYYFDPNTQSCLPFTWGGCKGVVPFETKDACKAAKCKEYKTRCLLSPDKGPCKGEKTLYFFDVKTLRCEKFKYGGCGGVAPFKNKKDCKNAYCHQYMFPVLGTAS